jgi:small subunit ribosomal protein S7
MLKGKKSKAEKIVYGAMEILKARTQSSDALSVLQKCLDNVRPSLEVKSRRIGGATYQVPVEVNNERGTALAIRWIRDFARARKGKPMREKLAEELLEAYKGAGNAVKKKQDTHKMAEANRAFAHYRW